MPRIVQKFGGTSVADLERIRNAALRVKREAEAGNEVAVVVSAMAGTTNQLVDWTRQMSQLHDAREYDVVVSAGEQVTAGLMALALQDLGLNARSWLGWQIPIRTDDVHGKARIDAIDTAELERRFAEGQISVVAGRILRRWRSPPPSKPTAATSSPMSMGFTQPIRASLPRRRS